MKNNSRCSRGLFLSFFQIAQVFFALGQDITYLADNASPILLHDLQNRFQGFQVKCFSFQRPFPVLIVLGRPGFIHIGDIVHRAICCPNKDVIQLIPENGSGTLNRPSSPSSADFLMRLTSALSTSIP